MNHLNAKTCLTITFLSLFALLAPNESQAASCGIVAGLRIALDGKAIDQFSRGRTEDIKEAIKTVRGMRSAGYCATITPATCSIASGGLWDTVAVTINGEALRAYGKGPEKAVKAATKDLKILLASGLCHVPQAENCTLSEMGGYPALKKGAEDITYATSIAEITQIHNYLRTEGVCR